MSTERDLLEAAELSIVAYPARGCHLLRCTVTELYLCLEPSDSKFRWCDVKDAAAKFNTHADAFKAAELLAVGEDPYPMMTKVCKKGPSAKSIFMPDPDQVPQGGKPWAWG